MQIVLNLSDEKANILRTAVIMKNKRRRIMSIDLAEEGFIEASKLFRKDLTLTEYALATLMDAVQKEVGGKLTK